MKKVFSILASVLLTATVWAQSPEKMSYQAVIRNSSDDLVTNTSIGMQISILQDSAGGTAVYVETQTPTTNTNGLVSIEIGAGTVQSGNFSAIDWANDTYFIKTETDLAGGSNYTITGTSQLLSVPYALHAKTAETVTGTITEIDPLWTVSPSFGITNTNISNWTTAFGWGNHSGLYRPNSYVPAWSEITSKPTTISGYGITDAMTTSHAANGITSTNITNWNSAHTHSTTTTGSVHGSTTVGDNILRLTNPSAISFLRVNADNSVTALNAGDFRTAIGAGTGTVTSIATGNGITGGTITTTGTLGLTGQALALHNLGTNGIIARTAIGTVAARTITAGTGITITNGNGVSGNPTIAAKTYAIGDFAHGGIVFWIDATGQHGLVCAKTNQSTGVRWYAGTNGSTQAKGDGPFAGEANTSIIIAAQVAIGDDNVTYAARICNELQVTEGGKTYGDWYLPSKEELNLMYQNKATINATAGANGGTSFTNEDYWSSSEYNYNSAWSLYFTNGDTTSNGKNSTFDVRAVRAF